MAQPGGLSLWRGRLFDIPTPNIVEKITKMVEVIGKVENLIRVVLENVCSIGRQTFLLINVTSNSEIFMSLG